MGRTGNDLHYRGYDILEIAETCEFEEIAHLLVHGTLPTAAQLRAYKAKLHAMRGIPAAVRTVLEALPAATHPMDVMRTAVSALGCALPEQDDHNQPGARDIADRLMASLGSMLLYWYHFARTASASRSRPTTTASAATSCTCCTACRRRPSGCGRCTPRSTSMPSTSSTPRPSPRAWWRAPGRTCIRAIVGGIGALRGPKHGGANEVALEVQQRYATRTRRRRTSAAGSPTRRW